MWRFDAIADLAAAALHARAAELQLEQAVYGLDAWEEIRFHPLLADAFQKAGFGTAREAPYPGEPAKRPRHAERKRCDLVLLPTPDATLRDPLAELKSRDAAEGTLFAPLAPALSISPGIPPEEALWVEVKLVGQHCYSRGIPGPNHAYASELLTLAATDIPKLAADPFIRHAALLLILFSADRPTADHDLAAFMHRCLDRALPINSPSTARFPIPDIIGNRLCTVCIAPVRNTLPTDEPEP